MYKVMVTTITTKHEFYSEDHFQSDGEIVYWNKEGGGDLIGVPASSIILIEEIEIEK